MSVVSRIAAALLGGYTLTNVLAGSIARVLPMPPADAVFTMILASFAIYVAVVVWVFAARTASRAWLGLLVPAAASLALLVFVTSGSMAA